MENSKLPANSAYPLSPPKFKPDGETLAPVSDPGSEPFLEEAAKALGLKDTDAAVWILSKIIGGNFKLTPENCRSINGIISLITEMKPEDPVEVMLLGQMVSVHNQFSKIMDKITLSAGTLSVTSNGFNSLMRLADKLMSTFTKQMETLTRYRRRGNQTISVKHFKVERGGQAIVGSVSREGGGR